MRHLLPISLGLLLLFVLSLAGFSLYQERQVTLYQKRLQSLMSSNLKLSMEKEGSSHREVMGASDAASSKNVAINRIISLYTQNVDGNVSVYYKNLTTGEIVIVDGDRNYYMASLYKIIITLYVLEREKTGEISSSDLVGDPPLTIEDALNKIITESNNEYAIAIAEKYGWDNINEYIKNRFGINFDLDGNLNTNVKNMGTLFGIISESIKLSDTESKYLLQLLNHQTRLSKLPKYLPKNIYSHNKTGELDDYSHDAGLFYTPKANYILIFMSKTESPGATNEQMALMSKAIFDELNK